MIHDWKICETPISFIDFETTGLVKGLDRIIEVGIARMEPGKAPKLVLNSLVNPGRKVKATEIHGITDDDVAFAPDFREIAGDILQAIAGSVVTSYNVYFDIPFLEYELSRTGVKVLPPYFCMMYMRPLLKLGTKCRLEVALKSHGISAEERHVAAADVQATAQLFQAYLEILREQGIETFGDLKKLKDYKFFESFKNIPIESAESVGLMICNAAVPRADATTQKEDETGRKMAAYWESLKSVVADLIVTDEEVIEMEELRDELNLNAEIMKAMHAKVFMGVMAQFIDDDFLDDTEAKKLKLLWQALHRLGWAPGLVGWTPEQSKAEKNLPY